MPSVPPGSVGLIAVGVGPQVRQRIAVGIGLERHRGRQVRAAQTQVLRSVHVAAGGTPSPCTACRRARSASCRWPNVRTTRARRVLRAGRHVGHVRVRDPVVRPLAGVVRRARRLVAGHLAADHVDVIEHRLVERLARCRPAPATDSGTCTASSSCPTDRAPRSRPPLPTRTHDELLAHRRAVGVEVDVGVLFAAATSGRFQQHVAERVVERVSAQATNARRSISWPLAAKLLPVRRPSTISCGRQHCPCALRMPAAVCRRPP